MTKERHVVCAYRGQRYQRMAESLKRSVYDHSPGWSVTLVEYPTPPIRHPRALPFWLDCSEILKCWRDFVTSHPDGTPVVCCDADMLVLRQLSLVFMSPFAIGYTTGAFKISLNAGVLFVRVNDESRSFVIDWVARTEAMLNRCSAEDMRKAREFCTPDQAALQDTIDAHAESGSLQEFPCSTYNCENAHFDSFDSSVIILHVKGPLRRALEQNRTYPPEWDHNGLMATCKGYGYGSS